MLILLLHEGSLHVLSQGFVLREVLMKRHNVLRRLVVGLGFNEISR